MPPRRFSIYFQVFDYYSLYKVLLRRFVVFTPTGLNLRVPNTVEINVTAVHVSIYSQDLLICGLLLVFMLCILRICIISLCTALESQFSKIVIYSPLPTKQAQYYDLK